MNRKPGVSIQRLATGVPGLDGILGGGLPEYSFNLIAGAAGSGKTTLAHQIVFANAVLERPSLYCTVLGEPPIKMLRYQRQMSFFDVDKVGSSIRFLNLGEVALQQDLSVVLERIIHQVEEINPGMVVIDSFQAVVRGAEVGKSGEMDLRSFVQRLAIHLTSWQATTFLVGDYSDRELGEDPLFTIADGIIWLLQNVDRNSVVRKLHVVKMRGQAHMPGLHTLRITNDGVETFPRMLMSVREGDRELPHHRIPMGVEGLDEMMTGGPLAGDSVLVAGPSGTGKSVFAAQFIAEGVRQGEPGVILVFEEHPKEYLRRARGLGFDLEEMARQGNLEVIYLRPLDLSPDETLKEIQAAVKRIGAQRVVIDSLSGFELALAPTFREDFREALYRLVGALTGIGVTVLLTMEVGQTPTQLSFSPNLISFLADDIILLRYLESEGLLTKGLGVMKMRGSDHSKELRGYEITSRGLVLRGRVRNHGSNLTGVPHGREGAKLPDYPGLVEPEMVVLQALVELIEAGVEVVARRTGLQDRDVIQALDRITVLGYAVRMDSDGRTAYRPVAQA